MCDSELLDLIKFWNSLKAKKLVRPGVSTTSGKGVLSGWKRVKKSKVVQTLLADRKAVEAKIRESEFIRDASWFCLSQLLGGKNKDGDYYVQKLMDGGYVSSGLSKPRSANVGAGVNFDPARSTTSVIF